MTKDTTDIAFLWENFGPMHVDRCLAVARRLSGQVRVHGIELYPASSTYAWDAPTPEVFAKTTLFHSVAEQPGRLRRARAILSAVRRTRASHLFLCHYNRPEIFAVAWIARLSGRRVFVLSCSKFDDMPRRAWIEAFKSLALTPYHGALSSGRRPRDYLRFLGLPAKHIHGEYNTLSVERMRTQAGVEPAPGGAPFAERGFVTIARLVPKKNLAMLVEAFALYRAGGGDRSLTICGSGPLEAELIAKAQAADIADAIVFTGFVQTDAVSGYLGGAIALLLPSIEEQFGNVVIEAQALGLPVILSDNCGARDRLVRSGVNGFVIEPDNPAGLAFFMTLLAGDAALWTRMATAAGTAAAGGDVDRFAEGVEALLCEQPAV